MSYQADVELELDFHTPRALARFLATLQPGKADPAAPDAGWAIAAAFSEFAEATIEQLRLTGRGTGRLLAIPRERLHQLARCAEGAIDVVGEDGARWSYQLRRGRVIVIPQPSLGLTVAAMSGSEALR